MSYKVKITCLQFSVLVVCLLFWRASFSQSHPTNNTPTDPRFDAVDQLLKQNQKLLGNNYVALVWKDGKIVYQHEGSPNFTPKMPVPIGEAANWMTAALVMTFVDEGKLSLDDKVTQYIPLFGKYSKSYITIRNCLTNTTGIRGEAGSVTKISQKSKYQTLEEEVNSYASKRDIVTNPGTEIFYSNVGINIAARVLEIISKKSFDRLMQDRIIHPCKMKGTSFSNDEGGATNPAGGARSTANDYISFLSMLLNKGMAGDKQVLSAKAVEELESVQFADLPIKSAPKQLQGGHLTMGAYITDNDASGAPVVLICPNMLGTTPLIDKCRNYAAILIVQKPEEEKKPGFYKSMKGLIDQGIGECK